MAQLIEKYIAFVVGLIVVIFLYVCSNVTYASSQEFIKQFTTIGACTFGFLLTLFSLIIQGDNQAINRMRKRHKPFLRFIAMNKRVVIFSFLLTVYAYIIGYIDITQIIENSDIIKIAVCLFFGGFIYFILETVYFLIIFYLLIQGKTEDKNDTMQ